MSSKQAVAKFFRHTFEGDAARSILSPNELSRLRRDFFDRINKINKIFLYSLYLPAGRQAGPEHPVYPV